MSTVFIALQTNEETRPIIEAIELDNPEAVVNREPAMVKINALGRLAGPREQGQRRRQGRGADDR